jgi:hypothetical protein
MGSKTLLITMNLQNIGQMSCNPAMGGIAKGQIVREIDALGGYSGIISDKTAIQFKMLNKSKGPAMWSPRVQSDRMRFSETWRLMLEQTQNLDFYQEMVAGILVEGDRIVGVRTSLGLEVRSRSVVLTNGTFLNGLIHIGEKQFGGGRAGEQAATGITKDLVDLGFDSGRMKTGTPPRVDGRSLDFSKMIIQPGDENPEGVDDLDVAHRIDAAGDMMHVGIFEAADDLNDGVDFADMGEKLVAQPFTLACAPDQTGDVDEFDDRRNDDIGLDHLLQHLEPRIGHGDHADVGIDGAKGIIRRLRFAGARDGIKQG